MKVRFSWQKALAAVAVLGVAAAVYAQSITLQYRYRQGERLRYDVTLKGNGTISSATLGQNDPFEMSGKLAYVTDVQSVEQGGTATVHTSVQDSSITATWGGQPIPVALHIPSVTTRVTPSGKILSCSVAGPTTQQLSGLGLGGAGTAAQAFDFSKFFGSTQNLGFPSHAVSPGSQWTDNVSITTPEGSRITISSSSTLIGFVTYQGRRCAKIQTTFTAPLSMEMVQLGIPFKLSGSEQGTLTTYFSPTEGRMIATSGNVVGDMTMSGSVGVGVGAEQMVAVGMQSQTDVRVSLAGAGSGGTARSR